MFRKVLFPTDFSDCSYKALECVRQMRGAGVEEVVIVSVLDERDTDLVTTGIRVAERGPHGRGTVSEIERQMS